MRLVTDGHQYCLIISVQVFNFDLNRYKVQTFLRPTNDMLHSKNQLVGIQSSIILFQFAVAI